jgi:hypothetical protein
MHTCSGARQLRQVSAGQVQPTEHERMRSVSLDVLREYLKYYKRRLGRIPQRGSFRLLLLQSRV